MAGPGAARPEVRHYNSALEDHFVVVLWGQRHAGVHLILSGRSRNDKL
jgi:hypothetical protein